MAVSKAFLGKRPSVLHGIWRRTAVAVLFMVSLVNIQTGFASSAPGTSASSAIVMEATSGAVLYEKDADRQMLIASTTKILTALVVLENCDENEKVVIGSDFPYVEGSSIYLKPGDKITVRALLYGLLLESGNDAAVALAIHTSGSIDAFSDLMNDCAARLGCKNSHFVNPHGLDAKAHYSSARDLALISAEAIKNKAFCEISSTKSISIEGRYFKNHNKLLWNYPGCIGIKTGYTEKAGRSLVTSAERDGMRLICVTLSAPNDWNDHKALFDWAYNTFSLLQIRQSDTTYGEIPVISGVQEAVTVHPAENFDCVYNKKDKVDVSWEIPRFVYAPVTRGVSAGSITVIQNGETLKNISLIYDSCVPLDETIPLKFHEKIWWSLFQK